MSGDAAGGSDICLSLHPSAFCAFRGDRDSFYCFLGVEVVP